MPVQRPPGASIIGAGGPAAIVTGPGAVFLHELFRAAPMDLVEKLMRRHRGDLPVIKSEIVALGVVAEKWRLSASGPNRAPQPDIAAPSVMTTGQAAGLLQVDARTVRRWIADGRLPAQRIGGRWVLDRADLGRQSAA